MAKKPPENLYDEGELRAVAEDERVYVFPRLLSMRDGRYRAGPPARTPPEFRFIEPNWAAMGNFEHIGFVSKSNVYRFYARKQPRLTLRQFQAIEGDYGSSDYYRKRGKFDIRTDWSEEALEESPFTYQTSNTWLYDRVYPIKIKVL